MTMPLRHRLLRAARQLAHGWSRGPDHIAYELLEMIETGSHATCDLAATMGCREQDLEPLLLAMQRRGKIIFRTARHGTEWHIADDEACPNAPARWGQTSGRGAYSTSQRTHGDACLLNEFWKR